ncbi:MAG: metal-dependent hydrolase [Planctomycetota bacterium]|jgi:hypothetical protein
MVPQQHFVISWVLSNLNYENRRDRIVTTICGIIPDLDGLGFIIDKAVGNGLYEYYAAFHHKACHNILALFIVAIAAFLICKRKLWPAFVSAFVYLVHLALDFVGSGYEEGYTWPIYPFWPFSDYELNLTWQWPLTNWKNTAIAAVFLLAVIYIAVKKRRTFLEVFSKRLDMYCIKLLEKLIHRKNST